MSFGNKTESKEETKNKPLETIRAGGISVAIWENHGKDKNSGKEYTSFSFSPQRSYKKGDAWENTTFFRVVDLPKLIKILEKCYEKAIFADKEEE